MTTAADGEPPSAIAARDYFYVGGRYAETPGGRVMRGQMYVERLRPREKRAGLPIVFFHGAGQTATNWLDTPDGRPGWAEYFAGEGYTVYRVDQPARGRSPWQPGVDGALTAFPAERIERLFTAPGADASWRQAAKHTQWPGSGRAGDRVFDDFYATQVPYLADYAEQQRLVREAGSALLDRIGTATLVTHSQSGTFGWILADQRPHLVAAIVALEPSGPPFEDTIVREGAARAWGLTDIPIAYDPPAREPGELAIVRQEMPDGPDLVRCWQQKEPARRLPNLAAVPVLVVTGEASYHAAYDHCTASYLEAAGVAVTTLALADHGVGGNGHMLMLEMNNLAIAGLVAQWLGRVLPAP